MEAIAEVGLLRALGGEVIEHVAVERPGARALGEGRPEEAVPGPAAGLELGLEALAQLVVLVGAPGRRLEPQEQRRLGARRLVVVEAVLAEQRQVADARAVAALIDAVAAGAMRVMALANILPRDDGQPADDGQVVGDAVGIDERRRQDGVHAVRMDVLPGEGLELGIAEGIDLDHLEEDGGGALTLVECGCRDGGDGAGAAGRGDAGGMMGNGGRGENERGEARAACIFPKHVCSPLRSDIGP